MPAERVSMRQAREIIRLKFSFNGSRDVESFGQRWAFLAVAGGDRRR